MYQFKLIRKTMKTSAEPDGISIALIVLLVCFYLISNSITSDTLKSYYTNEINNGNTYIKAQDFFGFEEEKANAQAQVAESGSGANAP